jgi:tellurite resistance protein TehA-like permease
MSNMRKLISTTSYDIWIAWTYAIISLLAVVAIYGLSTHVNTDALATIASLHSPGP